MRGRSFGDRVGPADERGCRKWQASLNVDGYGRIWLSGKVRMAHRVAWELANGPIPNGMCVLHKCDQPACVATEHLLLGTQAQNIADRVAKGRNGTARGEAAPNAQLTPGNVRRLRMAKKSGEAVAAIARELGVAKSTAHAAATGKSWKHVHKEESA